MNDKAPSVLRMLPSPHDAYRELERRFARMYLIRDAATVLEWDASTFMPDGGADARSDQMATLRVVRHEMLVDSSMEELLARAADANDLDEWQRAGVWGRLHALLLAKLRAAGELEWSRAVADSSHVQAKKEALRRARARLIEPGPAPSITFS